MASIVDYLKAQGQDSSYAARKKLAEQYGIAGYSGTASQNLNLLAALQGGQKGTASGTVTLQSTSSGPSANATAGMTDTQNSFRKSQTTQNYQSKLEGMEGTKPGSYEESDRVTDYYDRLQEKETEKPDAFKSQYEEEINSILDSILNNKEFSYTADDLANDDLYQMYRENYMRQGDLAMRDTMGNVAALTGGYGSTYAAAAGQQAYDNYLANLNDAALEFADRAYSRYRDDIAERYNQLGAVTGLDNTDYARYRDTVSDYYNDLNYLAGRYDQEYAKDYGQYRDDISDYYTDRSYLAGMYDTEYGHDMAEYQNAQQMKQWADELAFKKEQAAQEQANWEAEMAFQREQYEYQKQKAASGGSSGSSKKSSGKVSGSADGGYAPLAAQLAQNLQNGSISDYDALEAVMQEMERGNLTVDEAEMAIQTAGIDKQKAIAEEAQSKVPKNIWELRLSQIGR